MSSLSNRNADNTRSVTVTVTKGRYLSNNKLYKTNKTIGRGVAELYSLSQARTKRIYVPSVPNLVHRTCGNVGTY